MVSELVILCTFVLSPIYSPEPNYDFITVVCLIGKVTQEWVLVAQGSKWSGCTPTILDLWAPGIIAGNYRSSFRDLC